MSDALSFTGELRSVPNASFPPASGDPIVDAQISEAVSLARKSVASFTLSSDSPQAVAMGPVVSARFVQVKAIGGPVVARFTSAAGTTQSVPVDSLLVLFCASSPITAIDLARSPGVATDVRVFLGE